MGVRGARQLALNESAAIAPLYAIGIFVLVGIAGVGFDYARMASLDSELQNAADQAALAGATQLDGKTGTCSRAAAAARTFILNNTRFAKDGGSAAVTFQDEPACDGVGRIRFWQDRDGTTAATGDANARFVEVFVDPRSATYSLTPLIDLFSTGQMGAAAMAGLGSSICKVPPLMMCENNNWQLTKGKGLRLVAGGGGSWTPGNFGYLEVTDPGANSLEKALGGNVPLGDCVSTTGVTTEPGTQTSVTDAINVRFDIFESGLVGYCDEDTGNCSPALNTRKDVGHPSFTSPGNGNGGGNSGPNCALTGNDGWRLAPSAQRYLPNASGVQTTTPAIMGHPRDICHAVSQDGNCTDGRLGNGTWDRQTYLNANFAGGSSAVQTAAASLGFTWSSITRYEMYLAEIKAMQDAASAGFGNYSAFTTTQGQPKQHFSYLGPQCAPGKAPSETQNDRRLGTVAVVDCGNLNSTSDPVTGKSKNVPVKKWVEVFFVEPSIDRERTSAADIYVEIVRQVDVGDGSAAGQPVRRDIPYLVR